MKRTIREKEFDPIAPRETLFCSLDKFHCGSGWPCFTTPLESENVEEHLDTSHKMIRTVVRSGHGGRQWGQRFDDSPLDKGGLCDCFDSALLHFISVEELESEGYGEYRKLFERELKA